MATDTTNLPQDMNTAESESGAQYDAVQLAQATPAGAPVQVQIPEGQNLVRVPVTAGETIILPFGADAVLAGKLGDNGNLAIKVGDVTVILEGYTAAEGQQPVVIETTEGKPIVLADVLSAGEGLDIQTAAGGDAAGAQGADNTGALFSEFGAGAGLGGFGAVGALDATELQYGLIDAEQKLFLQEAGKADTVPVFISTEGGLVNEDDLDIREIEIDAPSRDSIVTQEVIDGIITQFCNPFRPGNDSFDDNDFDNANGNPITDYDGAGDNDPDYDPEPTIFDGKVTVDFGPDTPGSLRFPAGAIAEMEALHLKSNGFDLHFQQIGDTELQGYTFDGECYTLVLTVTIVGQTENSDGTTTFDVLFALDSNLDHPVPPSGTLGEENDLTIPVPLEAVDSDGSVTGGSIPFGVHDDIPFLAGGEYNDYYNGVGHVDEDFLEGGNHDLPAASPGDDNGGVSASGSLHLLVSFGADGPAANPYVLDTLTDADLSGVKTSDGHDLHVLSSSADKIEVVDATDNSVGVFTLTLNVNGFWEFSLLHALQETDGLPNTENNLLLNFGVKAFDYDGDAVALNIQINVDDDMPNVPTVENDGPSSNGYALVDEDPSLAGGLENGPGDDGVLSNTASGTVIGSFGADGPAAVDPFALVDPVQEKTGLSALDGKDIIWHWIDSSHIEGVHQDDPTNVYFNVTLDTSTGAFTFTLLQPIQHPEQDDFLTKNEETSFEDNQLLEIEIKTTDADGDSTPGTIKISIDDDTPVAYDDAGGSVAENSGEHNLGTVANVLLSNDQGGADGLDPTSFHLVSGVGSHGGSLAIVNGDVVYTAPASVDNTNDPVTEEFYYTVADKDGDVTTAKLTVTITDANHPEIGVQTTILADEDGLEGGEAVAGAPYLASTGDDDANAGESAPIDTNEAVWHGKLNYSFGGDGKGDVTLGTSAGSVPGATGLTDLAGNPIVTSYDATTHTLTGYVESGGAAGLDAGDAKMFTMVVNDIDSGDFTFNLLQPIKHPDQGVTGNLEDNLSFTVDIGVTDKDGSVANGSVIVNIDDDAPTLTSASVSGSIGFVGETVNGQPALVAVAAIDEDFLTIGNHDLPGKSAGDDAGFDTASGNFQIAFGADGAAAVPFALDTVTNATFAGIKTAEGHALEVKTSTAGLIEVVDATDHTTPVFTLTMNNAGTWFFTLQHGLDEGNNPANTENNLTLNFTGKAFDNDGDYTVLPIRIIVDDDMPSVPTIDYGPNTQGYATIDEDALSGGVAGGPGDDVGNATFAGKVVGSFGGDGPAATNPYTFDVTEGGSTGVNSLAGNSVVYHLVDAGHIEGRDSVTNAVIFTVALNNSTGDFSFELKAPLDHPSQDNPATLDVETDWEDNLALNIGVKTTDADGDSASSAIVVSIDDDSPVAFNDHGASFEENSGAHPLGTVASVFLANDVGGADDLDPTTFHLVSGTGSQGGTLSIDINGNVTYTPPSNVNNSGGAVVEEFSYTVADKDGDVTTAKLQISITDSGPSIDVQTTILADEDGLSGGQAVGIFSPSGDLDANAGETSAIDPSEAIWHGKLNYNFGNDGKGDVILGTSVGNVAGATGLTDLSGNPVVTVYDAGTHTLTGFVDKGPAGFDIGDTKMFTMVVNNIDSGDFTFTLLQPMTHPDHGVNGNLEDNLLMPVDITVKDSDGSTANGSVTVNIDDDVPLLTGLSWEIGVGAVQIDQPFAYAQVDEDFLSGGNQDKDANGVSNAGQNGDNAGSASTTGTIMVAFGADGAAGVPFVLDTVSDATFAAFKTSEGHGLHVDTTMAGSIVVRDAVTNDVVFSLTLNSAGAWSFTLSHGLQHSGTPADTENDVLLNFTGKAYDKDGDWATFPINIRVDDDLPLIPQQHNDTPQTNDGYALVDEDALAFGQAGGPGDDAGTATATGSVTVAFGADGKGSFGFDGLSESQDSGLDTLDGKNVLLHIVTVGDHQIVTGYADDGAPGYQGTETPVFTLDLNVAGANVGKWQFDLLQPVKHDGHDDPDVLGLQISYEDNLNLSFGIKIADADGDSQTGAIKVSIDDDSPSSISVSDNEHGFTVDEDWLLGGNQDADGAGLHGDDGGFASVSGTFHATFGADQPGHFEWTSIGADAGFKDASANQIFLADGTTAVMLHQIDANHIIGYAGTTANVVFDLTLNATTGDYTFTLQQALKEPPVGDGIENNLFVNFTAQAVDNDGDAIRQTLQLQIDDDIPQIPTQHSDTPVTDNGYALVDEDFLAAGNHDLDASPGENGDDKGNTHASGQFNVNFGGDGAGSFGFNAATVVDNADTGLDTLDGHNVLMHVTTNGSHQVVTGIVDANNSGTIDNGEASEVFKLDLDTANGKWTFDLEQAVAHPDSNNIPGDNATDDGLSRYEDNLDLSFAVKITDKEGDAASGALKISIDDDSPTARNDSDSLGNLNSTTGNVITGLDTDGGLGGFGADLKGADGASVTKFVSDFNAASGAAGGSVVGHYGTLQLNGDGSYTYTRSGTAPLTGTDVFTYTLVDGDGDAHTAKLTLNIADHGPSVQVPTVGAGTEVDEKGLPPHSGRPEGSGEGSDGFPNNDSDKSEKTSGTITYTQGDAPATITIDGVTVTGVIGQAFTGDFGTLTITSVTPGSALGYTYTLTNNADHSGGAKVDDFAIVVKDADNDPASTTLTINIIDDVPTAHADTNSVASGGLLSVAAAGVETNDVFGADGKVAGGGVVGVSTGSNTAVPGLLANVGNDLTGSFGKLHLNADGSYTYQANANASGVDHFVYTIKDADGDISTTTLDITVTPSNLLATNDDEVLVYEKALDTTKDPIDLAASLITGSLPGDAGETDNSNTLTDNVSGGVGTLTYALVGSDTGNYGKIQINSNGTYTYTLTKNFDTTPDADNSTQTEQDKDSFTYKVTDSNGNTATATIYVDIVDDVPSVTVSKVADAGILLTTQDAQTDGNPTNDDTDATTINFGGIFSISAQNFGADGAGTAPSLSYGLSLAVADGTDSTLDSNGASVFLYNVSGTIVGSTSATAIGILPGNTVFSISVSGSGAVTLTQNQEIDHALPGASSNYDTQLMPLPNGLVNLTASATITDGDGDKATSSQVVDLGQNIRFADDGPDAVNDGPTNVNELGTTAVLNVESNDAFGADGKDAGGGVVTGKGALDGAAITIDADGEVLHGNFGNLTLKADGSYTYTSTKAVTKDETDTFSYSIKDGDGDTDTANITITVKNEDKLPVNYNDATQVDEPNPQDTNVMIIFDRSGSMADDPAGAYLHRIDLARDAVENLLTKYDALGDVHVMIVSFSTGAAQMADWGTIQDALNYLDSLTASGTTNYDAATTVAETAWNDTSGALGGRITAGDPENVIYFLSDGVPNAGNVNTTVWDNFLENSSNGIDHVYAVAVGSDISGSDPDLLSVAKPDGDNNPPAAVLVAADENTLSDLLGATVGGTSVAGNVLGGAITTEAGHVGQADAIGDGPTYIAFLKYNDPDSDATTNPVTFKWDGDTTHVVTVTGAAAGQVLSNSDQVVTFKTEFGLMTFYFRDGSGHLAGDFVFTPNTVASTQTETFHYYTVDTDGTAGIGDDDTETATPETLPGGADLVITINNVNQHPVASFVTFSGNEDGGQITVTLAGTDDGSIVAYKLSGLPANGTLFLADGVTAAVAGVEYASPTFKFQPNANFNGDASFQYTVKDNGGLFDLTPATATVTVNPVNDAPAGTSGSVNATEDTAFVFSAGNFGFSDPTDGGANAFNGIIVTTLPGAGSLRLNGNPVLAGDSITATQISNGNLTYVPINNVNGNDNFTFQVKDNGGTANGGVDTDQSPNTLTINVTPVNDAPVLDATKTPVGTAVAEDAGAPFGAVGTLVSSLIDPNPPVGGNNNVTDVDGPSTGLAVIATDTSNGTWWYSINGGTNWLAVGAVTDNSARLLLADANTRVYFQPNGDYDGQANLTFRAWDGSTGSNGGLADPTPNGGSTAYSTANDTATFDVTAVNDAPVNAVPGAQAASAGVAQAITGVSISDIDDNGGNLTVHLSVQHGTLLVPAGAGVGGNGTESVVIIGTEAFINGKLAGLTYTATAGYSGSDTLNVLTSDGGNTGTGGTQTDNDDVSITVTLPPIAPTIVTPGGLQYWSSNTIGDVATINRISFQDADSTGATVRVTLSMDNAGDALTAASGGGVTVGGSATEIVTLDGTIAAINAFLYAGNVRWNPSGSTNGDSGTLTISIDDNGTVAGGNIVSTSIAISEISPTLNGNANAVDFSGVNFDDIGTDPNAGNGTDIITTTWNHDPTTAGVTTYDGGAGTDTITLVFTPDQLAAILADSAMQNDIRTYFDGNPTGDTLTLGASPWNADVTNFETAHISLATGYGVGTFSIDSYFNALPTADNSPDADTNGDLVVGDGNANVLTGGAGSGGNNGNDVLVGLAGDDSLSGGSGNDLLLGGDGNDTLTGGTGVDVLSGGRGVDTFVFGNGEATVANADVIVDYSHAEGDVINLSGLLDANFGPASVVSDFVKLTVSGNDLQVQVDTDGGANSFATVATLVNYNTAGADPVKVFFEAANHDLSA